MAKRISSIFSIGSNYSIQSQNSDSSRFPSSVHPARPSRDPSPAKAAPVDPRPTSNLQNLHNNQSSGLTPPFNPTILPRIEDDHPMLRSPHLLSPILVSETSPNGSRRASIGSRPQTSMSDPQYQNPLLRSLPIRSESPFGNRPGSRGGVPRSNPSSRPGSRPSSRPASPVKSRPQTPSTEQKLGKHRTWLPGKSKAESQEDGSTGYPSQAWVVTPQEKLPYDVTPLANFQVVPELWDENGDTFVYLHARDYGRGPSFKVDSSIFASSKKMVLAAHGTTHTQGQHKSNDLQHHPSIRQVQRSAVDVTISPSSSQLEPAAHGRLKGSRSMNDFYEDGLVRKDLHLCLPLPLQADLSSPTAKPTVEDIETLVTLRNVFAFLTGQLLVATPKQASIFTIFMRIADILQRYEFTNLDGSTLGEEVAGNFAKIIDDFNLADVRPSREKTIEAIVLGERMRSWPLYNEGFVHAVGKYDDISGLKSPKFSLICGLTRQRLERAHLDLFARLRNIQTRLNDFDFPSLFAGVANSTTSADSKVVHFKDWKSSYLSMRRHVVSFYKNKYGSWPPKAKSKKNDFEESGLNRVLLLDLYQDFSDLYDILVDRKSQTTRSMDLPPQSGSENPELPRARCLRRVLDEYDRSTPPVQPPVPFDIPQLPSLFATRRGFDTLDPKKQRKESAKKLADVEINHALMQSYNRDSVISTPFLDAFMAFERRSAHGKSIDEIADLRDGQWLFMYAVLESLPLLVVDAPGVQWTKGVEYFLCEVPRGSPPWVQETSAVKQSWYGVAGGAGMVALPADVVEHGVEGIYRRSHCWQMAEKWTGFTGIIDVHPSQQHAAATPANPGLLSPPLSPSSPDYSGPGSPSLQPGVTTRRRASVGGLEQLPLPPGVVLSGSRPLSLHAHDPSKTFGAILAQSDGGGKKKK